MGQSYAIARMVQDTVHTLPWKGIIASAALYFIDRHVHEGRGDKVAFREYPNGWVLSYGMMAATSDKIFGAFGQVGIAREELAAMLVLDYLEFLQIFGARSKQALFLYRLTPFWPLLFMTRFCATAVYRSCSFRAHYTRR